MKLKNKTVPISALRLSKFNWKRNITDTDIEDLASNFSEIGNLHPIIVRQVGKAGTMYEILAGARRWRAHRMLGSKKVDVRVADCTDLQAEIISYSENLKIKRPESREWSAGVKHLVDLFEKINKTKAPKQVVSPRKSKGSSKPKDSDFRVNVARKSRVSIMGRPKSPRSQAIKDVAKNVGASVRSVQYALRREEDLIPSAIRALEMGSISQTQADQLAVMPVDDQKIQLSYMVRETREQTKNRITTEKLQKAEDKKPVLLNMLSSAFMDCKELQHKLHLVLELMDGVKLKKEEIVELPNHDQVEQVRDALNSLLESTDSI
jgi:ParB/RepB/Spo0J family partition protein